MEKKTMMIPVLAVMIFGMTAFVVPQAHAQTVTPTVSHTNFFSGLIDFIAQKFGLDKTQVQSAVNDYKTQRKATMTPRPTMSPQVMADREKTRLDKLVSAGKITSAQETAIIAELASLRTKYNLDSMQNETPDQRKTQMQSMQADLKTWETSQNINLQYVQGGFGMGGMRGGLGMRGFGHKNGQPQVTPTP